MLQAESERQTAAGYLAYSALALLTLHKVRSSTGGGEKEKPSPSPWEGRSKISTTPSRYIFWMVLGI